MSLPDVPLTPRARVFGWTVRTKVVCRPDVDDQELRRDVIADMDRQLAKTGQQLTGLPQRAPDERIDGVLVRVFVATCSPPRPQAAPPPDPHLEGRGPHPGRNPPP